MVPAPRRVLAALPLLLMLALLAPDAAARDTLCSDAVHASIDGWQTESGFPISERRCPLGEPIVILEVRATEGAPAYPLEIRRLPGPAFRAVADRFGVSPIANADSFEELPEDLQRIFTSLCDYLSRNPDAITFDVKEVETPEESIPSVYIEQSTSPAPWLPTVDWMGPWGFLLGLAALGYGLWRSPRFRSAPRLDLALLFGGALLARAAFGLWGPCHVNFQGALWISVAQEPIDSSFYGPGYPEIFHWLTRVFAANPDYAIFAAVMFFSALVPVLVYLTVHALDFGRRSAILAGLLLAADPVSVRWAATESYFPLLVFFVAAVTLSLVLALRGRLVRKDWLQTVPLLVAAALLTVQAARIHPSSFAPLLLTPFVAAIGAGRAWRPWAKAVVWQSAFLGLGVFLLYGRGVLHVLSMVLSDTGGVGHGYEPTVEIDLLFQLIVPCAIGSIILVLRRDAEAPFLVTLSLVPLLALLVTREEYGWARWWMANYDRLFVVLVVIPASGLLTRRWLHPVVIGLIVAALGTAAYLYCEPDSFQVGLAQKQYRFFRSALRETAPDCLLAFPGTNADFAHGVPIYIASAPVTMRDRGVPVNSPETLEGLRRGHECVYYVRPAFCDREDKAKRCTPTVNLPNLVPIREEKLDARIVPIVSDYLQDPVTVGIYRIEPPGEQTGKGGE